MPRLDGWQGGYPSGGITFERPWWSGRWLSALAALPGWQQLAEPPDYRDYLYVGRIAVSGGEAVAETVRGWKDRQTVRLRFRPLPDDDWDRLIGVLADDALTAWQVEQGELPPEAEGALRQAGVDLFPRAPGDVAASCTCDQARVCQHIIAACRTLSSHISAAPWLLFQLRGRSQEAFAEALRARRAELLGPVEGDGDAATDQEPGAALPAVPDAFWRAGPGLHELSMSFTPPRADALPVKQLGSPTFLSERRAFLKEMEQAYRAAGAEALRRVIAPGR